MNDQTVIIGASDATLTEMMRLFPHVPGAKLRTLQQKKTVTPIAPDSEIMGMGESREDRKSGLYIPMKGYLHVGYGYEKHFTSIYAIGSDQISTQLCGIFIPEDLPLNPFTVQSGPAGVALMRIPYADVRDFFFMTNSQKKFVDYQTKIMSEVLKKVREKNIGFSIQLIFLKAIEHFITACSEQFKSKKLTEAVLRSCEANPEVLDPLVLLTHLSQSLAVDLNPKMKPGMQKLVGSHAITYGMMRMLEE